MVRSINLQIRITAYCVGLVEVRAIRAGATGAAPTGPRWASQHL